jgi:Tfp pilus assembly protein PilF
MNYGVVLMGKGDLEGAREYFERALPLVPRYAYLHVNLAVLENAEGNPEKAETYFRNALSYDSGNPMVYYYYGRWLNERRRVTEALEILEKGKQVGPGDAKLTKLLDSLTEAAGQPVNVNRYIQLSLEQYRAEQYRECVETCRQALEIQPESSLLYNNMCSCYNKLREWDRAIEACQRALEIDPEFSRARANLDWARSGKAGG